ncbi:MAG: hypothetical protein ACLP8X_32950 [Streptosporangiaceae bacterium]
MPAGPQAVPDVLDRVGDGRAEPELSDDGEAAGPAGRSPDAEPGDALAGLGG